MSHSHWFSGEPKSNFDCVQYKRISGGEPQWSSADCRDRGNFVCELGKFSIRETKQIDVNECCIASNDSKHDCVTKH